jgi:soluble lytic murein transglycosylase-like protein
MFAAAAQAQAQIFIGTSEQSGALVLSNFASKEASVLLLSDKPLEARSNAFAQPEALPGRRGSPEIDRIVALAAARTALSPNLIHAVIATESNYQPSAVSNRGAIGLMQLLPSTARRFGAQDPFDPAQNIAAGAAYLKWLKDFFADDLELALAGYNAGEQAVIKAGRKVPPYVETRAYVDKVKATLRRSEAATP